MIKIIAKINIDLIIKKIKIINYINDDFNDSNDYKLNNYEKKFLEKKQVCVNDLIKKTQLLLQNEKTKPSNTGDDELDYLLNW